IHRFLRAAAQFFGPRAPGACPCAQSRHSSTLDAPIHPNCAYSPLPRPNPSRGSRPKPAMQGFHAFLFLKPPESPAPLHAPSPRTPAANCWRAGTGSFADGVESGEIGAAIDIGDHAAAGIMRRGHDRNRLARDIDAEFEAARQNRWKMGAQEFSGPMVNIQIHAIHAAFFDLEINRARD